MSVALALVLLVGSGLAAWWLGRPRETSATAAVRGWAARRGLVVRSLGDRVEVVGRSEGRFFTVSLQEGPPPVLLVAVDCSANTDSSESAVATTDDGALVSRWTNPTAEHLAGLDQLVGALVQAAVDLEGEVTTPPPPE